MKRDVISGAERVRITHALKPVGSTWSGRRGGFQIEMKRTDAEIPIEVQVCVRRHWRCGRYKTVFEAVLEINERLPAERFRFREEVLGVVKL